MMSVKGGIGSSVIYPMQMENDLEKGEMISNRQSVRVSRASSFVHDADLEAGRMRSSPSLTADLVEAAMLDGQYRFLNDKTHEAAMWCGLFSFLIMGLGLVGIGLFMALRGV